MILIDQKMSLSMNKRIEKYYQANIFLISTFLTKSLGIKPLIKKQSTHAIFLTDFELFLWK